MVLDYQQALKTDIPLHLFRMNFDIWHGSAEVPLCSSGYCCAECLANSEVFDTCSSYRCLNDAVLRKYELQSEIVTWRGTTNVL
ncbi:unnamed protein product [Enterobius vermicularis]|uniref:Apple domain-containing protein n=1 Tax=Enterobius vermicularis TaxID=51028 RepID=A0A0N4VMY4_ENTVE|nr:unnamed protein product [Enterobius vermicularis]